jgi:hypothetical protein
MSSAMWLLHLLGAIGMGFYVVLPVILGRASKLAGAGQGGLADGLIAGNRIAQYCLVLQILTGGYMMSKADYSVLWMVIVMVLFLGIAAFGGIISKPLKGVIHAIEKGQSAAANISKAKMFSLLILVLYVAMIYFMKYPIMK